MKMLPILPLLLLSIAPAAAVSKVDGDDCVLAPDIQTTNHLADIPAAILKGIPHLGDSIPPAPDDAVVEKNDPPGLHLIRAFSQGERWVVVYSSGGPEKSRRALVLDLPKDGKITRISNTELWHYPGGACQSVDVGFEAKARR